MPNGKALDNIIKQNKMLNTTITKIKTSITDKTLVINGTHMNHKLKNVIDAVNANTNIDDQIVTSLYEWCNEKILNINTSENPKLDMGTCEFCGKKINYTFSNNSLNPIDGVCFTEKTITTTINIPTGKMIANDMVAHGQEIFVDHLKLYKDDQGRNININYRKGLFDTIYNFAKQDIIHIFVGNSCPSVFKHQDTYTIGNHIYNEDETSDDEYLAPVEIDDINGDLGLICTDLWWTTLVDIETYKEHIINTVGQKYVESYIEDAIKHADVIMSIKPGLYELTYIKFDKENIDEDVYVYGSFTRIGECINNKERVKK